MKRALLALCAAGTLSAAAVPPGADSDLAGDIKTVVTRYMGMMSENDSFYGSVNAADGVATVTPIYKGMLYANGENYDMQSSVIRNNILYIPELYYDELGMIVMKPSIRWKRVDLATGEFLEPLAFGEVSDDSVLNMFTYSLTYDEVEDKFYGLVYDAMTEAMGRLVEIDASLPELQWRAKVLGDVGSTQNDFMSGIVFNPSDRKLYGIKDNGTFNEIEIENGEVRVYELVQYDDFNEYFCFPMTYYPTAMCYSPYDKAFIINNLGSDTDMVFRLAKINAETFEAENLGEISPMSYMAGLFCMDPYAPDQAPDRMKPATFDFDGSSLSGTYTVILPSKTFDGVEIAGNVILHVVLDGEEIYRGAQQPGSTYTGNITTTQGYHTLEVYASIDDFNSPATKSQFYVGFDSPKVPTNLALKNGLLTWKAPAAGGQHNGFLDPSDLTYDVYFNGEKHNTAPITKTEYRFELDTPAVRTDITVKAVSNGVSSENSKPLNRMLGKGLDLPTAFTPTSTEAADFEIFDANGDGEVFAFQNANSRHDYPAFAIQSSNYSVRVDDWLFLPPVYCDDISAIYSFIYKYRNVYGTARHFDDMDIYLGTDPTPEGMTTLLYTHTGNEQIELIEKNARFTVPNTGTYFIGIHTKPGDLDAYPRWHGIELSSFQVTKEAGSTKAPGTLDDVSIEAAPLGDLSFNISATLPTVDLNGDPLPSDQDVTLNARTAEYTNSVIGKPGQTVSLVLPAGYEGLTTVYVYPSSEEGTGMEVNKRLYVGIDTPLPPTNIKGIMSADNRSVTLTWDPVGTVGLNGGYVDPASVTYQVYTQTSTTQTKLGNAGNANTLTVQLGGTVQEHYFVGPVAFNEVGNSTNGTFLGEIFGDPHKTPMQEEFGYTRFNYAKWYNNTAINNGSWDPVNDPSGLGMGDFTLNENGGLMATPDAEDDGAGIIEMFAPKVSTEGVNSVALKLTYWDYENCANLEVWGRTFEDQDPVKIGELTPTKSGQWQEWELVLPENFGNQPWIQVNLRSCFAKPNERFVIDNYALVQNIDFDYQLNDLEAPFYAFVGDAAKFNVVVTNSGAERASGTVTVDLLGDGEVINSESSDITNLLAGANSEYEVSFEMLESYVNYSKMEVRATTTCEGDQNATNNMMTVEFLLKDNTLPVVRDLTAKRHENGHDAVLEWSEPDTAEKNFESFEAVQSFGGVGQLGRWLNVDLDGKAPFVIDANVRWPGDDSAENAWIVFDCEAMGTMSDARLFPHTGKRVLMARSVAYNQEGGEEPSRSAEFLVSPEVKGGSKVSFWINTLSTQYPETFEVWYSTTGTNLDLTTATYNEPTSDGIPGAMISCGDFKRVPKNAVFTKSGSETWEQVETTLPEDAKYFAIVYASFGDFAGMVDDIEFEAANPGKQAIDSYDVYVSYEGRDPEFIGTSDTPGFTHKLSYDAAAIYYVKTVVANGSEYFNSALSNPAFVDGTGVDSVEASSILIGGAKGHVLVDGAEGLEFALYDLEGRLVSMTVIESSRQAIPATAGIYIARVGNTAAKVIIR